MHRAVVQPCPRIHAREHRGSCNTRAATPRRYCRFPRAARAPAPTQAAILAAASLSLSVFHFQCGSTAREASSISFYLCGIAILLGEHAGRAPPFSRSDRIWLPVLPADGPHPCSHLPDASLAPSAFPSDLRSVRSSGWRKPHPAPSSLAVPVLFQDTVDVRNGFVQILDHPLGSLICRSRKHAQLPFTFHGHVQVQIHSVPHFLGERFSAQFRAPGKPLLLYRIHMNKRRGHIVSYIAPISYHTSRSPIRATNC